MVGKIQYTYTSNVVSLLVLFSMHKSPLGFIKNGPYGSPEDNFRHYRSVEVKHGRIAMAATLGMLTQQTSRFDGFISPSQNLKFEDIPNGLGALKAVPLEGWVQIAVLIGLHEVIIKQRPGKAPGDFGTGYFGVAMDDQSAKQLRSLNAEIANGRLGGLCAVDCLIEFAPFLWYSCPSFCIFFHFLLHSSYMYPDLP